jgi:DNA-binding transcriptional LysR family regulator
MVSAIDWRDLNLFLTAVEAGSLTKASARTGLSQPTLGRRLRALETVLGLPLAHRRTDRLEPTEVGAACAAIARDMRDKAEAAARLAQLAKAAPRVVRISASTTTALLLTERVAELADPGSGVVVEIANSRASHDPGAGTSDVALRLRRPPGRGPMTARRIGRLGFAVYGALGADGPLSLAGARFIGLAEDRPPPQPRWLDAFAAACGGRIVCRLGEVFLRLQAAKAGVGATLLPCLLGDREPGLARLTAPVEALFEEIYLLVHQDLAARPEVRAVAARTAALIRREGPALAGLRLSRA